MTRRKYWLLFSRCGMNRACNSVQRKNGWLLERKWGWQQAVLLHYLKKRIKRKTAISQPDIEVNALRKRLLFLHRSRLCLFWILKHLNIMKHSWQIQVALNTVWSLMRSDCRVVSQQGLYVSLQWCLRDQLPFIGIRTVSSETLRLKKERQHVEWLSSSPCLLFLS